jgi:membrane glycosyltransferase
MEADPKLAIVQHLVVGRPASAAFPRLFQFGMRAGMRIWATGQAWWQGDEGPYWGHNAIIRIAPFRAHARLDGLIEGRPILSHDQVEAVRLHAAGWKVAVLPIEAGSLERNPPALPEFMERDLRWAAGNTQYVELFTLPGIRWMGRWQLAQAILLFASALPWVLALVFATGNARAGGESDSSALLLVMLVSWGCLHAPKLLGYAEVLLKGTLAAEYGGRLLFALGALLEVLFTTLLDPVSTLNKAMFLVRLPLRRREQWAAQQRGDRPVSIRAATRLLWPHTLFGAVTLAILPLRCWVWALPWIGGLIVAIPFCVLTSSPRLSAWFSARRLAATPEELHCQRARMRTETDPV